MNIYLCLCYILVQRMYRGPLLSIANPSQSPLLPCWEVHGDVGGTPSTAGRLTCAVSCFISIPAPWMMAWNLSQAEMHHVWANPCMYTPITLISAAPVRFSSNFVIDIDLQMYRTSPRTSFPQPTKCRRRGLAISRGCTKADEGPKVRGEKIIVWAISWCWNGNQYSSQTQCLWVFDNKL